MSDILSKPHHYDVHVVWNGASEGPTTSYAEYSREWLAEIPTKVPLRGSADEIFRGDGTLYNPEDLLVVALSTCHMLSYLALCARAGIAVAAYVDDAHGTMMINSGRMRFIDVLLKPRVTIVAGDLDLAIALHEKAHEQCFIASSVNFPVRHDAVVEVLEQRVQT